MATGGGPLPSKRAKIISTDPTTSPEKVTMKYATAGNIKVSNGNMMTNHDSISPRKDSRTNHSASKNASGCPNQPNNRKTSQMSYDTLHVDVDLANRRFSSVSPGRRCLSDSKLTVGKPQKNIPVSSNHKRKIEFSTSPKSERVSSAKRRRSDGGSSCSSSPVLQLPQKNSSGKHIDYNQNIKVVSECAYERTSSCTCSPGEKYKSIHSIGHRKASAQIATLSEALLTSPHKLVAPQVNSTMTTLMSHKLELSSSDTEIKTISEAAQKATSTCPRNLPYFPALDNSRQKVTTPSTPDSLSEDISDRFLKVDSDILFKKESTIEIVVTDCDKGLKQSKSEENIVDGAFSNPLMPRNSEDQPNKQVTAEKGEDDSSVFTEDSSTTEDSIIKEAENSKKKYVKKNWDIQPRAPRKRRIASLTAETKVHLLYEKDDIDVPRKSASVRNKASKKDASKGILPSPGMAMHVIAPPTPNKYAELRPFTLCKHQAPTQTGTPMPCADCRQLYYSFTLKEQDRPLNLVLNKTCSCADVSCSQCAGQYHSPCITPGRTTNLMDGSSQPPVDLTNRKVEHNTTLAMHSPMSAPVISPSKRPTLVPTSMRRATVDTAECQKLTSFMKSPLMLRVSRHSTDGIESDANMPVLVEQLDLLQTGGVIPPLLNPPCLLPTNHLPKSRIPKKILNPANLKPVKAGRRKSTNGWKGVGEPVLKPIILLNDAVREYRYCYDAIRRKEDEIRAQDCVLLRAGTNRRKEPAYVAKVAFLWEEPDTGDLMMTLLWYYQPEHTEAGRLPCHLEHELFACRHWDVNSVACIEDRCFVLTPAEYSRYRAKLQRHKEAVIPGRPCVPEHPANYPRTYRLPPDDASPANVFLCRQVYDFRQKRVLKNPS
ncbi:uncharacterized protein LOC117299642 [Asterias rubens]|uniref:uncharacterized protein LOC117299642 n=1 Tax=Asterias rubens TaxID=7604 RepID=UPI00145585E3|nr:uncharacterized protein LOC117299642 [Asterias rubens]